MISQLLKYTIWVGVVLVPGSLLFFGVFVGLDTKTLADFSLINLILGYVSLIVYFDFIVGLGLVYGIHFILKFLFGIRPIDFPRKWFRLVSIGLLSIPIAYLSFFIKSMFE